MHEDDRRARALDVVGQSGVQVGRRCNEALLRGVSLHCNVTLLRYAADRLLQERVAAAPSLREVASGVGTSTRAVYSLSGSKEGLPGALDAHAIEMLHQWVDAIPASSDRL